MFWHDILQLMLLTLGYIDSCADIAYALLRAKIPIITPKPNPAPVSDADWSFPDTEAGIVAAVAAGATHLWANTVVFAEHPLQTSRALDNAGVFIVGQPPKVVEAVDDKNRVNEALRAAGMRMVKGGIVTRGEDLGTCLERLGIKEWPVIGKPVRGRGSQGVKLCNSITTLAEHTRMLLEQSAEVIVEEHLGGEEGTVTVLPIANEASPQHMDYSALPIVIRSSHVNGIMPYSNDVPVTANSRVVTTEEMARDPSYQAAMAECERAAAFVHATAPMRIDVRRKRDGAAFAMFDVNMKPVSTMTIDRQTDTVLKLTTHMYTHTHTHTHRIRQARDDQAESSSWR